MSEFKLASLIADSPGWAKGIGFILLGAAGAIAASGIDPQQMLSIWIDGSVEMRKIEVQVEQEFKQTTDDILKGIGEIKDEVGGIKGEVVTLQVRVSDLQQTDAAIIQWICDQDSTASFCNEPQ